MGAGASWSREGVVRSFGFRRCPVPLALFRLSRDGEVRIEFVRGTGSLDVWTGIFDGRGVPLGLFGRVSSMLIIPQLPVPVSSFDIRPMVSSGDKVTKVLAGHWTTPCAPVPNSLPGESEMASCLGPHATAKIVR